LKPLLTPHQVWLLKKVGTLFPKADKNYKKKEFLGFYRDNMVVTRQYVSGGMSGAPCPDRSIMNNLHKEKPEVQAKILEKAKRVAVPYNKGGYQYIDETDPKTFGRK
jgi:hypothetical protein